MSLPLTFGDQLAKSRKAHGIFQRQIADVAEVALATVCDWEKNRRNPPTSRRALAIARLFKTEGALDHECAEIVSSAARTRGSFVFETDNELTLRLLTAICLREGKFNKSLVTKIIRLM